METKSMSNIGFDGRAFLQVPFLKTFSSESVTFSGEDTWEPLENLEESMNEVEAFKERRKRRDRRREEKRIRKERLFNAIHDPNSLPAIPVFDISMDVAARPLTLPKNFDENKWELAEPFMCPFCDIMNGNV